MKDYYVYQHTFTNGTIYIGKGEGKRWKSKASRNKYWLNLLNKYGEPQYIKIADNLTESEAFELEELLIKELRESNTTICNITDGGNGCSGYKHTEEHKKYIGEFHKLRRSNPEVIKSTSEAAKGDKNPMYGKESWCKGLTKETDSRVKTISEKLTGIPKTEEHKKKLSEAKTGKKLGALNKTKYVFKNKVTEQVVIATVYEMKQLYGCDSHISSVVSGKRKSHKNWELIAKET